MDKTQDIQAKEIELRKTIQSKWISVFGAGLFIVATIALFFIPALRSWQIIIPIGLVGLIYVRRAMVIKQAAKELERELAQLQQEASAQSGDWPPPPRNPAA